MPQSENKMPIFTQDDRKKSAALSDLQEAGLTEVVAALIWDKDQFLICQRPESKACGLLWEFVGGKVEPGETKPQALIRECREELAITVTVGALFMEVVHAYPDLTVRLSLFHAAIAEGTAQLLEHNDMRWITVEEIPRYTFCPADRAILAQLQKEGARVKSKVGLSADNVP